MNDQNKDKDVLNSQKIAAQDSDLHQHHGLYVQPQQASYVPETSPIDLSQLEVDPWLAVIPATENRVSSGSTIPDPQSIEEGGRTWQAYREGSYFLPNDASEQDRLDMQHFMFREMLNGRLFEAPLDTELRDVKVLDIGTGTGIWAMEFGEKSISLDGD